MSYPECNFPDKFNDAERLVDWNVKQGRGNKVAIYYYDEEITYQQVMENVNRTGNALKSLGIEMENRVMILALDCPQFIYTFFGAMKIGAVPIPTNTMLTPNDYLYILNDSRAKAIVVSKELVKNILKIKDELLYLKNIIVVGDPEEGTINFNEWISGFSTECETAPTSPSDPGFMMYSSGTTGVPKGIVHKHSTMSHHAECYARGILELTENDRNFSVARLFFGYGIGNAMYFPFYVGAATILHPGRPQPEHILSVITKYKPTVFFGVPTSYNAMLQLPDICKNYDLSSLRLCISAGEPLPGPIWTKWRETTGVEVLDGIGSTEMLHMYISNRIGESKPDCTGKLIPGHEVKIVDDEGNPVPVGETGTLMVKGWSSAMYYWHNYEKTKSSFQGWWFNSGDSFYQDADGFYYYCGRGDDMIKAGGIWVSPIEVETTLMKHPAVLECGVAGCPDDDGLFKPKAFVVFKEGVTVNDELINDVKLFVKDSIAPFKFPRWIVPVNDLPKTATGKIQRYKLRQMDQAKK